MRNNPVFSQPCKPSSLAPPPAALQPVCFQQETRFEFKNAYSGTRRGSSQGCQPLINAPAWLAWVAWQAGHACHLSVRRPGLFAMNRCTRAPASAGTTLSAHWQRRQKCCPPTARPLHRPPMAPTASQHQSETHHFTQLSRGRHTCSRRSIRGGSSRGGGNSSNRGSEKRRCCCHGWSVWCRCRHEETGLRNGCRAAAACPPSLVKSFTPDLATRRRCCRVARRCVARCVFGGRPTFASTPTAFWRSCGRWRPPSLARSCVSSRRTWRASPSTGRRSCSCSSFAARWCAAGTRAATWSTTSCREPRPAAQAARASSTTALSAAAT